MSSKKVSSYQKVSVPDFSDSEDPCNDNRFFSACYHFCFLIYSHVWTKFLNLDELWQLVDDAWKVDTSPNKQPEESHQESYDIIKAIDPTLFCWYNYLLLSLFARDASLDQSRLEGGSKGVYKTARRYAWYSVVYFVNQNCAEHEDIDSEYYQEVHKKLQSVALYATIVSEIGRKKLVDSSTRETEDMDIIWSRLLNYVISLTKYGTAGTVVTEESKEIETILGPKRLDPRNVLGNTLEFLFEETQIQYNHNKAMLNALTQRRTQHQETLRIIEESIRNIDTDRAMIMERIRIMKIKVRRVHEVIGLGNDEHKENLPTILKACKELDIELGQKINSKQAENPSTQEIFAPPAVPVTSSTTLSVSASAPKLPSSRKRKRPEENPSPALPIPPKTGRQTRNSLKTRLVTLVPSNKNNPICIDLVNKEEAGEEEGRDGDNNGGKSDSDDDDDLDKGDDDDDGGDVNQGCELDVGDQCEEGDDNEGEDPGISSLGEGDSSDCDDVVDTKESPNVAEDPYLDEGSDIDDQSSELGKQGSDLGDQGSELGKQGSELGNQGSDLGDQGSELSNHQGSELGTQGSELGNQGSDLNW